MDITFIVFILSVIGFFIWWIWSSNKRLEKTYVIVEEAIFQLSSTGGWIDDEACEFLLDLTDTRNIWMLKHIKHNELTLAQHLKRMVESKDQDLGKFVFTTIKPNVEFEFRKLKK